MAVSDKHVDELCSEPWNGLTCPHGLDHTNTKVTCLACLEYAMQ